MYDADNPIALDKNTVFFDNNDIFYIHRQLDNTKLIDFKSTHFYDNDKNKIQQKYNYFSRNTININLFIGLNSTYCSNNMLNSTIYLKDTEQLPKAFNDSKSYKGKSLEISLNPMKLVKTYGTKNPNELFEKIDQLPFEDINNIENVESFFSMPTEIKYPRYFNHYSLSSLNSNISVFGTLEEIDGTLLFEKSIKGIKCDLINNGLDARERSVGFSSNITLTELTKDEDTDQKYKIESYSDEEYEDLVTGDDTLLQRSFAYTTKIINGQVVTVFDTSSSTSSLIPRMSNKVIFYSEDSHTLPPFIDRNIVPANSINDNLSTQSDYNVGSIFPSHGHDSDNSQGSGPDSVAFIGAQD